MDEDGTAFGKGANEAAVDLAAQAMQMPGDSVPEGTSYAPLCLKVSKVTNSSIKVWGYGNHPALASFHTLYFLCQK